MFGLLSEILLTFRQQWEENHSWCQVVMFILHVNLIRWWYPIIYQTPIYILLWGTFLDVPNIYFIFFYWILFILFFNFIILYRFCHISKWVCHRYTFVPHPEPSSLLPPHTIPLGCPGAPVPSIQYRASNLDWQLVSYMILYMFQCHSPKSFHPLPLQQSP